MELKPIVTIPTRHQLEGVSTIRGVVYRMDLVDGAVYAAFGSNTYHRDLMVGVAGHRGVNFPFGHDQAMVLSLADESGRVWGEGGVFLDNKQVRPTPPEILRAKRLLTDFTLQLAQQHMPDVFRSGWLTTEVDIAPLVPTERL